MSLDKQLKRLRSIIEESEIWLSEYCKPNDYVPPELTETMGIINQLHL